MIELLMEEVQSKVLNNTPSVSLALGDNPLYLAKCSGIVPVTDALPLQLTVNGNTSVNKHHTGRSDSAATTYAATASSSAAAITTVSQLGNAAGESASIDIFVPLPASPTLFKPIFGAGASVDNQARAQHTTVAGYWSGGVAPLTSVELAMSAGNFKSGEISLWQLTHYLQSHVGMSNGIGTLLQREDADDDPFIDLDISGDYSRHLIVQLGVVLETDGDFLYGRIGTAGGIKSTGYKYHGNVSSSAAATYAGSTRVDIATRAPAVGNVGGECSAGVIEIASPDGAKKIVSKNGAFVSNAGHAEMENSVGTYDTDTDPLTTFRVLTNADNILKGTFLVYGIE